MSLRCEIERVRQWEGVPVSGRVTQMIGLLIESTPLETSVGELCYIYGKRGAKIPCEVVGFKDHRVLLMSLGEASEVAPGSEVFPTQQVHQVAVTETLRGRVLDALGNPIDDKGPLQAEEFYPVTAPPPPPLKRGRIDSILTTGMRAVDGLLTLGKGQRLGIFSGAGVGKSSLMGALAKTSQADLNVIALIGERGREVREFIERDLGPEGLARSVVVVATADQAALLRSRGANVATAIAEYFRDLGQDVLLMMDSVSRVALALREIGLAIGEPPTTRGYTPSVFATLPRLLERAGPGETGSITGVYTVLTDRDDPLAEQMRSLLDGHIVLSRELANAHYFPPIDVLESLSRVMDDLVTREHKKLAGKVRTHLQAYKEAEELINIGAYVEGSNPKIDTARAKIDQIRAFLRQDGPLETLTTALSEVV